MVAVGHFGCPKFTFNGISGHFRSIRIFFCFLLNFVLQMATGGHFGCSKIIFNCVSGHFRSIGHFGCPKFTFDGISGHFRSISNIYFYFFCFFDKMAAGAILDGTTKSIIELVLDIWMSNACVKFEERSLNPSKVIKLIIKFWGRAAAALLTKT